MENNLANPGDHWATIAIPIITVIIALIQPLIAVLFLRWLRRRERRRAAAKPDVNQPSGNIKIRIWFGLLRDIFLFPLFGVSLSVAGLIFELRKPVTQSSVLVISMNVIAIGLNLIIGLFLMLSEVVLAKIKRIESRLDEITEVTTSIITQNTDSIKEIGAAIASSTSRNRRTTKRIKRLTDQLEGMVRKRKKHSQKSLK